MRTIEYTTNFVDEDEVKFLHPHKFLASDLFHQLYVPLESLSNAYATGSRTFEINGETGKAGPIVFTKGSVSRLSTEGRESQYDETGRNFSLNLTNISCKASTATSHRQRCHVGLAVHAMTVRTHSSLEKAMRKYLGLRSHQSS